MDYRTDLKDFILDQFDYVEERLKEACDDATRWKDSLTAARGVIPQLQARCKAEDKYIWTQIDLIGSLFNDTWWDELAAMEHKYFQKEVRKLLEPSQGMEFARKAPEWSLRGV